MLEGGFDFVSLSQIREGYEDEPESAAILASAPAPEGALVMTGQRTGGQSAAGTETGQVASAVGAITQGEPRR